MHRVDEVDGGNGSHVADRQAGVHTPRHALSEDNLPAGWGKGWPPPGQPVVADFLGFETPAAHAPLGRSPLFPAERDLGAVAGNYTSSAQQIAADVLVWDVLVQDVLVQDVRAKAVLATDVLPKDADGIHAPRTGCC